MRSDMVAAADQTSIDAGPWVLSGVALLEPPPPFHSFAPHQSPTPQEMNIHLYWIQGGWRRGPKKPTLFPAVMTAWTIRQLESLVPVQANM